MKKVKINLIFVMICSMIAVLLVCILSQLSLEKVFAEGKESQKPDNISSFSAYLTEAKSGEVMLSYNENERHEIASMTKIMSNVIFFEEIASGRMTLDEKVAVSTTAAAIGGSTMFLDANQKYSVSDLLKGIIVASANDACVALAERVAGSEEAFTAKMNELAKHFGMANTNFVNCTGLPKDGQFSTAKDVNIATRKLLTYNQYYNFSKIWFEKYTHPTGRITELANTNRLIRYYAGCDSGKTGYTDKAKHCLSASAIRNGLRVVATVIGSPDGKTRFREVSEMFNYGFSNYEMRTIISKDVPFELQLGIKKGRQKDIKVGVEGSVEMVAKKNDPKYQFDYTLLENLKAPLKFGDAVGELAIKKNGNIIKTLPIIAKESIESATYFDYLKGILRKW